MTETTDRWVWVARDRREFETGAVYSDAPASRHLAITRLLQSGERIAVCPLCGQEFAATLGATAEENRDRHAVRLWAHEASD